MSRKRNKYIYEFATEVDGEEISKILEGSTLKGKIDLAYAKRPNAVLSLQKDGIKSVIVVGRDAKTRQIHGFGMCVINEMFVLGKVEKIAYLCGLRMSSEVLGNIAQCYKMLGQFCFENQVKYTYTTILEGNLYAQKILLKERKTVPKYIKHSSYIVNLIGKNLNLKGLKDDFKLSLAEREDVEALHNFIQSEGKNKNFFLNITKDMLENGFFALSYKDFYLMKNKNGEILACGVLWEQLDHKQLIVKGYSPKYKILSLLANQFLNAFHLPSLPLENGMVKYSTLSFALSKDDDPDYFESFVRKISHEVPNEHGFFVYSATQNTVQAQKALRISPFKYKSFVYLVDWDKSAFYDPLFEKPLYIECALL